jgi:histone H3/H4
MPEEEEQDRDFERYLPIANVSRIMKRGLPDNAKISKEAKECVQDCVSEFIAFVSSEGTKRLIKQATDVYMRRERQLLPKIFCGQSVL